MRTVWSLAFGLLIGGAVGVLLVMVFAPATGVKLRRLIAQAYREALAEARTAGLEREAALRASLAAHQTARTPRA